jgi:tetratricopeptide (TPR) repeat protein
MAQCYLGDDAPTEATVALHELLATAPPNSTYRGPATFLLGEAQTATGDWSGAEASYMAYLKTTPILSSLAWQRIAAVRESAGNLAGALEAYTTALASSPDWSNTVTIRRALAALALKQNDDQGAVAQYDALRGQQTSGAWAAEMQWLAGNALSETGDLAAAIQRWQAATTADPKSKFAHSAMVALVDNNGPIDEYLRGLVDYYSGAYQLAVEAFDRYRATDPTGRKGEAWYYAGLSYLALDETDQGLAELGNLIAAYPDNPLWADAWMAKARAQAGSGDSAGARATYRQLAQQRPGAAQAPKALWQAANLEAEDGTPESAVQAYLDLARRYPAADEGWQAYLAAGLGYFRQHDWRRAGEIWAEMAGAQLPAWTKTVAYYWLGRAQAASGETQAAQQSWQTAWQTGPTSFYGLRAADWAAETNGTVKAATPAPPPTDAHTP